MSRHRNVRTLNVEEAYGDAYDDVYGHSVEDDYCVSPSTAAQFMYDRSQQQVLSTFMSKEPRIPEEEEDQLGTDDEEKDVLQDSSSFSEPQLSDMERARLYSCLEELRNIIGDSTPEHILVDAVVKANFDHEIALNAILTKNEAPKPQRQPRNRSNRDEYSDLSDHVDKCVTYDNDTRDFCKTQQVLYNPSHGDSQNKRSFVQNKTNVPPAIFGDYDKGLALGTNPHSGNFIQRSTGRGNSILPLVGQSAGQHADKENLKPGTHPEPTSTFECDAFRDKRVPSGLHGPQSGNIDHMNTGPTSQAAEINSDFFIKAAASPPSPSSSGHPSGPSSAAIDIHSEGTGRSTAGLGFSDRRFDGHSGLAKAGTSKDVPNRGGTLDQHTQRPHLQAQEIFTQTRPSGGTETVDDPASGSTTDFSGASSAGIIQTLKQTGVKGKIEKSADLAHLASLHKTTGSPVEKDFDYGIVEKSKFLSLATIAANSPPKTVSLASLAASNPPKTVSLASLAANTPPINMNPANLAENTPPKNISLANLAANIPPKTVSLASLAASTPPGMVNLASLAASTPPKTVNLASLAASTPPKTVNLASLAASTPPGMVNLASLATSTPPGMVSLSSLATSTPPGMVSLASLAARFEGRSINEDVVPPEPLPQEGPKSKPAHTGPDLASVVKSHEEHEANDHDLKLRSRHADVNIKSVQHSQASHIKIGKKVIGSESFMGDRIAPSSPASLSDSPNNRTFCLSALAAQHPVSLNLVKSSAANDQGSSHLTSSSLIVPSTKASLFAKTLCTTYRTSRPSTSEPTASEKPHSRFSYRRQVPHVREEVLLHEIVPFDFSTLSSDDIVKQKQKAAFVHNAGRSTNRSVVTSETSADKPAQTTVPAAVVAPVTTPSKAAPEVAQGVARMTFSASKQTKGFDSPSAKSELSEAAPQSAKACNGLEASRGDTDHNGASNETPKKSAGNSVSLPAPSPAIQRVSSKAKLEKLDFKAEYEKRKAGSKDHINLVVIGHVDAGKSTLMGHVLYQLGFVNQRAMHKYEHEAKKMGKASFAYAWVLDETEEERSRGVTMDIAQTLFETDTKVVTLLDAPGHKDFIPNMITGAAQADVAILVVNATRGEFETGFETGGQTREHAMLIRSLGVSQLLVAINKMDTVDWAQSRFDEITRKLRTFLKQAGFRESDIEYVPCSGLNGQNLTDQSSNPEQAQWYNGPFLSQQIDMFRPPERPIDKSFRLSVTDVFKGQGSGFSVSGTIQAGYVQPGDKILVMPQGEAATVKVVLTDNQLPCQMAFAGDNTVITLVGIEMNNIGIGSILCSAPDPIRSCTRFRARVVIFNVDFPITKGFPAVIHYQSLTEPAHIRRLVSQLHKSTGEVLKNKPRCLVKNSNAIVEIEVERPICLELYRDYKDLGRFMLRSGGHTIAAGLVTEIINSKTK